MPKRLTEDRAITLRISFDRAYTKQEVYNGIRDNILSRPEVSSYLVAEEYGTKTGVPHFQGWIKAKMSDVTLKNLIKKTFPLYAGTDGKSTGMWSAAYVQKDTYYHYVLKGTATDLPTIAFKQTLDYPDEKMHELWEEAKIMFPGESTSKSKNPTSAAVVDEAYQWAQDQQFTDPYSDDNQMAIAMKIHMIYMERKKSINNFHLQSQLRWVMCKMSNKYLMENVRRVVDAINK